MRRHRHQEFIRFFKKIDGETPSELDLAFDRGQLWYSHASSCKILVMSLSSVPSAFRSKSSSWLNLVERWFREITDKRIRPGTFQSLLDPIRPIKEYLENYNQNPQVFVRIAPVERILEKYAKCKEVLDSLH